MRAVSGLCVVILLSFLLMPEALAQGAGQNDWSGGGGYPGPLTGWLNRFASAQSIDWTCPNGPLTLLATLPSAHAVTTTFGEPAGAAAGDLDGDGDIDMVSVAFQGDEVVWWENDGSGGGWGGHTIATSFNGACSLHLCDIDDDGDLDVAATAEAAAAVMWWANNGSGGGWTAHPVDTIAGPYSVCDADFDGDGDLDLCGAAFNAGMVAWWENTNGSGGAWLRHPIETGFVGAWWADAEDLDGDGDIDIAGVSFVLGDVCWWANNGTGTAWTKQFIDANFAHPVCVRLADMDGDADLDALAASNNGQLAWWDRDGATGIWSKHLVAGALGGPFAVRAADLDGDGDLDVIGNERDTDRVTWYENVGGAGLVWCAHLVDETSDGPNDVLAADLDGDGGLNVIATFSWDNSIIWYAPGGAPASDGSLESSVLDCGGTVNNWGDIVWASEAPPGTSVRVEVRAANDPANMGPWSEVLASGEDLSAHLSDLTRYVQYRVSMTGTGDASPGLHNLYIEWDYVTSAEEGATADPPPFYCRVLGNPTSAGAAAFEFALPRSCVAALSLFDLAGRQVRTSPGTAYSAGRHSARIQGLAGGVYFYVLRAEEFRSAGKLIVR